MGPGPGAGEARGGRIFIIMTNWSKPRQTGPNYDKVKLNSCFPLRFLAFRAVAVRASLSRLGPVPPSKTTETLRSEFRLPISARWAALLLYIVAGLSPPFGRELLVNVLFTRVGIAMALLFVGYTQDLVKRYLAVSKSWL